MNLDTLNHWRCELCGHEVAGLGTDAFCNHKGTAHANGGTHWRQMKLVRPATATPDGTEHDGEGLFA